MSERDFVEDPPVVLVVMGVSGTGKSTVAGMLAGRLGWDLEEDEDRWPWLDKIAAWIQLHTESGTPGVITCSALKRVYRDRLRGPGVAFVHLDGSREVIGARLSKRLDHFMPSTLLDSQLATLEPLAEDEVGVVVQLGRRSKDEVKEIMTRLHLQPLPPPKLNDQGLLSE